MNIEGVRAFVAVAEEGQFQHAAARLGVSQQAVSKRIAALEAELGTALFRRTPSGAALTQDGRTFLPHAGAVLAAVRGARASVQPGTRPLRVVDPVPAYPWSLTWRADTVHQGARRLAEHVKNSFEPPPAGTAVWLPRQARDDLAA